MTLKALRAIELGPFGLCRERMRIMTAYARHAVPTLLFAHALCQAFHLTEGGVALRVLVLEDKVADVVVEFIARTKVIKMFTRAFDGCRSFEMTLHTDGITANR